MALCNKCHKTCGLKKIDEGIGPNEAWGVVQNDVRTVIVSDCCEDGYVLAFGEYESDHLDKDYDDTDILDDFE